MPFVTQNHRDLPDMKIAGDRCYLVYAAMVEKWKESPRWTTADEIYQALLKCLRCEYSIQDQAAHQLAWQVFFQLHVMPYELKKREENGDID